MLLSTIFPKSHHNIDRPDWKFMKLMTNKRIETHVRQLFETHFDPKLLYHNLQHTLSVVKRASEISKHELPGDRTSVLFAAAWFHDTGQLLGPAKEHEVRSINLMREYFLCEGGEEEFIDRVASCIMATKLPCNPKNIEEEILCDADLYHLGTTKFQEANKMVKSEIELRTGVVQDGWYKSSLLFLKRHKYHTGYCRSLLQPGINENIARL